MLLTSLFLFFIYCFVVQASNTGSGRIFLSVKKACLFSRSSFSFPGSFTLVSHIKYPLGMVLGKDVKSILCSQNFPLFALSLTLWNSYLPLVLNEIYLLQAQKRIQNIICMKTCLPFSIQGAGQLCFYLLRIGNPNEDFFK